MLVFMILRNLKGKMKMAHKTEPQVFCIGESKLNRDELENWLTALGVSDWSTDAEDEISELIEMEGRACYLSFGTDLNENINRVRTENKDYVEHIVSVRHGSVLEHSMINFQILDVSRVFTHELVRHRVGVAISQESLRYVRVNNLGYWIPPCLEDIIDMDNMFKTHWRICEDAYQNILKMAGLKEYIKSNGTWSVPPDLDPIDYFNSLPFDKKKAYTSAARRFLPIGMATKIGWSCNIRTLRSVLEMRTHPSSEEELRLVFSKIGFIALERWPYLFSDYTPELVDGSYWFKTEYSKV